MAQVKPFSLDVVLEYRKRLEDQAQNRLSKAKQVEETVRLRLDHEKSLCEKTIATLDTLQVVGIEIGELIRYENRIDQLNKNIIAIGKNLKDKAQLVDEARENLQICSRDYQIMKQLKVKKNKAWRDYLNKKEAATLDEIGVIGHGRKPL